MLVDVSEVDEIIYVDDIADNVIEVEVLEDMDVGSTGGLQT